MKSLYFPSPHSVNTIGMTSGQFNINIVTFTCLRDEHDAQEQKPLDHLMRF